MDILIGDRNEIVQKWTLSQSLAWGMYFSPLFILLLFGVLYIFNKPFLSYLTMEDGVLEWTQVFCFFTSLLLCILISRLLFKDSKQFAGFLYCFAILGLFFIVGEEIAWGQRIFNFGTPENLAAINNKKEISFHNISSVAPLFTIGKLGVGIFGVFGYWIIKWVNRYWDESNFDLFVIPAFLSSPFLIILAQRILRLTILRDTVPLGYSEIEETFLAYGTTAFTFCVWRRLCR